YRAHRDLHSFPTRRSSDLVARGAVLRRVKGEGDDRPRLLQPLSVNAELSLGLNGGGAANCVSAISLDVITVAPDEETYEVGISRSEEHTSELQSRGHLVCR